MTVSTLPLDAQSSGHPVHRATAMLREALDVPPPLNSDPAELWDEPLFRPEPAPVELTHGPVSVTTPNDSLVTLLGFTPFEYVPIECQPPVTHAPDSGAAAHDEGADMGGHAVQAQLQGLVHAFHERQRQASLLVACSVGAAIALTLVGMLLLFGTTGQATPEAAATRQGASAAPGDQAGISAAHPELQLVSDTAVDGAEAKIVLARSGRPIALGPLVPLGVARYVLLRGLPDDATLSAGRKTSVGTWMVKAEDVAGLTLTPGMSASGDYPTEIYLLDSAQGPQARRRLILRVDPRPQVYAAGLALGWPTVFPETSQAEPVEQADVFPQEETQAPIDGGDIVSARRLLTARAARGEAEAAYELALTYDAEVLERAGLDAVEGDMATARAWYARAAQAGHQSAALRLKVIARRPAGA